MGTSCVNCVILSPVWAAQYAEQWLEWSPRDCKRHICNVWVLPHKISRWKASENIAHRNWLNRAYIDEE